ICRAVSDGVTFVVAAGNAGVDLSQPLTMVPGAYDEVITVSALADSNGQPCGAGTSTKYGPDDTYPWWSDYATAAADQAPLLAHPRPTADLPRQYPKRSGGAVSAPLKLLAASRPAG